MTTCPYPDCGVRFSEGNGGPCPRCTRFLKACDKCHVLNRSFARFCRACGRPLAESPENWTADRGGAERRSLNRHKNSHPFQELPTKLEEGPAWQLGDPCAALLFYDGHLVAISEQGRIQIIETGRGRLLAEWRTDEPLRARPCIHGGVLYLAGEERLFAYPLGGLHRNPPRTVPLWSQVLPGKPTRSLLAAMNGLYMCLDTSAGLEIHSLDRLGEDTPGKLRKVYTARQVSPLAANLPPAHSAYFVTQNGQGAHVGRLDGSLTPHVLPLTTHPGSLAHHHPIAVIGRHLFVVFGANDALCQIDASESLFRRQLCTDARFFALVGAGDGLVVQSDRLLFLRAGREIAVEPGGRVSTSPVILRDFAAVVGLQDGQIRVYDLDNPYFPKDAQISEDPSDPVRVIASWRDYVAAGTESGTFRLLRLAPEKEI